MTAILFRRGVLEFPPDTNIDPVIFLQADSEINGYQVFVNLSGPLTDTAALNASVRSNPASRAGRHLAYHDGQPFEHIDRDPDARVNGLNTAAEV